MPDRDTDRGRPAGTCPRPRCGEPEAGRHSCQRWPWTWSAPWWLLPFEESDKLSDTTIKFQVLLLARTRGCTVRTVWIWWPEGGDGEESLRVNPVHVLCLGQKLSLDFFVYLLLLPPTPQFIKYLSCHLKTSQFSELWCFSPSGWPLLTSPQR